eukprot:gene55002-75364_t
MGKFDLIFCRNVLIYFDQDMKSQIFGRLSKIIEPDGFLALGAAETVVGLTDTFKPHPDRRGVYRPNVARATPSIAPDRLGALNGYGRRERLPVCAGWPPGRPGHCTPLMWSEQFRHRRRTHRVAECRPRSTPCLAAAGPFPGATPITVSSKQKPRRFRRGSVGR